MVFLNQRSLFLLSLSIGSVYAGSVYGTTTTSTSTSTSGAKTRADCGKGRSAADKRCCVWYDVLDDVQQNLFDGGQCDEVAHDSLRLTFHDAIGYSASMTKSGKFGGGGADGSIMYKSEELDYPDNIGLDDIVEYSRPIADKWKVTYGDFIQFTGAVSVRNCPGGPQIPFYAGRPAAKAACPNNGLLPGAADSVDSILNRMNDAGFSAEELVWLLAAHSIGVQEHTDTTVADSPFDSTPQEFDTQFYLETLLHGTSYPGTGSHVGEAKSAVDGVLRLASDNAIARDPRTACTWQSGILNERLMQKQFRDAMFKLSLVGQNKDDMYDCSEVIPDALPYTPHLPSLPVGKKLSDIDFSCYDASKWSYNSDATQLPKKTGNPTKVPKFDMGKYRLHGMKHTGKTY